MLLLQGKLGHLLKLTLLFNAVDAKTYGENHVKVQQDSKLVAANFPDIDIELLSPAFANPDSVPAGFANGTEGPTPHATLDNFIRTIAERNDWATYHVPDFKSEEGRTIPYLYLSQPSSPGAANSTKLKVWIQAAIHGNEPAADQGALALLAKLDANQTWTATLLEKLDIILLPRYNVDGVEYFQRELASNLDPNRDHAKLKSQQTRGIKRLATAFSPHIVLDLHEYSAHNRGGIYQIAPDSLLSYGRNLNIHPQLRALAKDLFIKELGKGLEKHGLTWEPYVTSPSWNSTPGADITLEEGGNSARSGMGAYGLLQTITILFETRGIRLADQHFQRRVATQLIKLSTLLETAVAHFDDVYSTIEDSIQSFINSEDDIVLSEHGSYIDRNFTFIDTTNGDIVQVPVNYSSTQPSTPGLTRARPEGYLIPRTYSELASQLVDSGVEVQTLASGYHGTVEALNITSVSFGTEYYEGVILATVTTEPYEKVVNLPAGSFWVSTRQRNAGLAFTTLEPEGKDSYVSFGLVPLSEGDEYPIFRVPRG
ncbi:hypothetical protein NM208_g4221 [Fusarium decemcellulare]|uniref:Uncharacterized protein n=1 Tax=Fusarium decemcellulare TaxID=57161 RepID=A0ACC1SLB7_9HYPO|nr:hypothetical protein NM208_g4221 [Fusarium decemcellulare]